MYNNWKNAKEELPDFNGKVRVKYMHKGNLVERDAWYETGDRRFPKGFSLIPNHVVVTFWKKI